jgi:hypothetical protein
VRWVGTASVDFPASIQQIVTPASIGGTGAANSASRCRPRSFLRHEGLTRVAEVPRIQAHVEVLALIELVQETRFFPTWSTPSGTPSSEWHIRASWRLAGSSCTV